MTKPIQQMKPMLAVNIEIEAVRFPCYASAKIDGVRGVVVNGQIVSRSLKPIPNVHVTKLFSHDWLNGYDGELVVGASTATDVYRKTNSAVSRHDGTPKITFYVFDNYLAHGTFEQRLPTLRGGAGVVILDQRLINNTEQLLAFEAQQLTLGYEGLILRNPKGGYKYGRSTAKEQGMIKIKRFQDSEAVILEVLEEYENTNAKSTNELGNSKRSSHQAGMKPKGRAGALRVREMNTGVEFSIGTGMNADDRAFFWLHREAVIGKIVKYKSFLIGVKDAPRFPVYLGGRGAWDM